MIVEVWWKEQWAAVQGAIISIEYDSKAHHRTRSMENHSCRRRLPLMIVWPTTVIIGCYQTRLRIFYHDNGN